MPVPLFRDARPAGWVNCFSICASAMPRAQNRAANGSTLKEDEILCRSGFIIYLWNRLSKTGRVSKVGVPDTIVPDLPEEISDVFKQNQETVEMLTRRSSGID